jgi:hypothetical protein
MGGVALSVEEAVDTGEARRALGEGDEGAVHSDAPPPPQALDDVVEEDEPVDLRLISRTASGMCVFACSAATRLRVSATRAAAACRAAC